MGPYRYGERKTEWKERGRERGKREAESDVGR